MLIFVRLNYKIGKKSKNLKYNCLLIFDSIMKRFFLIAMTLILSVSVFAQQKIQLRSADKVECVKSDMNGLQATFSFSTIEAQDYESERGTFSWLSLPNTVRGGNEGDPQIPVINQLIAVPFGANPSIEITSYSTTDYRLADYDMKTLVPRQPSLRKSQRPEDVPFVYNANAYQTRGLRSAPQAVMSVEGTMRGVQLGKMTIEPVSYDPVNNTIRVFNDIEVTVHFDGADRQATEQMLVDTYSPYFDIVYKSLFNGRAVTSVYDDHQDLYSTPVKMLVVTTSTYANSTAFQNWLTWKKQKGIEVDVQEVTSSTTSANVRSLIQSRYNANHPTFLVIVGDETVVPYYSLHDYDSYYGDAATDLEYASVDNDIYHDMFMSRMPVASTTQLGYLVDKTLMYEKYTMPDPSYLNETLLIAGWDEPDPGYTSWTPIAGKPTINYATNNYFNTSHGITAHAFITTATGQRTCYNYINQVGFVNYTAHGNIQEWSDPSFTNSNVNSLTNANKPFWAMGNCCLSASYSNTRYTPCFGETMVRAQNKGAFGYIGSVVETYWYEDLSFGVGAFNASYSTNNNPTLSNTQKGTYDAMFDDTGFNTLNAVPYIGNIAVSYIYANNYTTSGSPCSPEYYWRCYQCFGDGSVMPYLKVPAANNVSHNSIIPAGASSFRVNADARSYVSITVNNEIIGVAAVPANATYVDVPFTTAPVAGQTAMIVVTRNQRQPYINNNVPIVGGEQYNITATASPTAGGTVEGAGQYYENTECTLIATANHGYAFDNWKLGNNVVSTEPTYTFTVTGDADYTANFRALTLHHITYNPQQNHGTISVSPTDAFVGDIINLTATPDAGYCLEAWNVNSARGNVTVVNNQFEMPDSEVTITATFRAGHTVTLASVMNGTISANPTTALTGETITLTATPASGYNFDSWDVFKTGDPNTTVSVSGNSFSMPDYDVTVSALFSAPQGGEVTIGSGTSTNQYIPTYNYYDYSLTQQIYTKAEVGEAGTITQIAFYVSANPDQRKIDIYMSHTSKSNFSSTSDWVNQGTSYRVVHDYQTFSQTGWNVITLDTPFEYNGTDNLLITVDDNTNDWSSSKTSFYVYSTGANRAHYTYQDDTDFNPASISANSYYNSLLTTNNQIKLTKVVPSTEGILSVSPTSLTGFNAVAYSVASTPQSVTVIGSNLQANLTVTAPNGYEVCASQNGTYSNTLTLTPSNGSLRTNFFVRLGSNVNPGTYSGNLTLASGTTTATVSLNGEVVAGSGEQYEITVDANPTAGGTVAGAGTYYDGSTCTLTATPATHYTFGGWQQNGNIVSNDNPYSFTVTGEASYTAVFNLMPQYNVSVVQVEGGTITADVTTAYPGDVVNLGFTANTGYFFVEWDVKDANNQTITVTNNQFTMPESNVTVTAVVTQGFTVTLEQTVNGTISADQTTGLQPGAVVTLTATPDNGCVFVAWYAYKTGNPRDVVSVISNQYILMPASDVTVQAIFVTEEEHEANLGSGTNTNGYIPTYVRANYSLTQQIYLASELDNQKGRITKIAYRATTTAATRNLTIYMAHTDKNEFTYSSTSGNSWNLTYNSNDWEVMGSVAKVFEGSVAFSTSDWTVITLDTPFEYDGTSNINICVVDNTGSTAGNGNNYTQFYRYGGNNRALYVNGSSSYANTVGYSNQLSNTTGKRINYVNQIHITMMVPGSAESLTLSPGEINDFSYVEGQGPSTTSKFGIVGVDLQNDITLTAPTNFEISLTEDGTYASSLTIPREIGSKGNRNVTTWGFEDGLDGWTAVDADNDGYTWVLGSACGGVYLEEGASITDGHTGTGLVVSGSYSNVTGDALTPDNWLISPQINELGGSFSMWAKAQQQAYPAEHFGIYVSTTGTNPSDFTLLDEWTLTSANWKQFSVDLGLYTGQQGYIAVRHFSCTDQFMIDVDDFELDTDASITIEMPVTITPATIYVRMVEGLDAGTYTGTLTASAGTGDNLNGSVSLEGQVILLYTLPIVGYGSPDNRSNYYLIASPIGEVDPEDVTNMIPAHPQEQGYDLYSFDPTQTNEWVNYKPGTGSSNPGFDLEPGKGYLYANQQDVTLVFNGPAYTTEDGTFDVTLTKAAAAPGLDFPDWNLVGNPFAVKAWIDRGFYTMNSDCSLWVSVESDEIEAMQGIFVVAEKTGDKVTFTTTARQSKSSMFALNLSHGRNLIDRAIVRLDGGRQLPKLQFIQGSTKVYIPVDGQDYAIVSCEEMGAMPVNFKAEENGSYTLSLSSEEVSFAYLHLIDNMTGADVDLLETPSYSFEAKTTDYESRFKLVFATGDNSNDDNFAFFSNGSFVINNDGEATLQVIDVTGRILSSESINGCTNVNVNAAPGVYMLRLINGDNVKVQKVVVK